MREDDLSIVCGNLTKGASIDSQKLCDPLEGAVNLVVELVGRHVDEGGRQIEEKRLKGQVSAEKRRKRPIGVREIARQIQCAVFDVRARLFRGRRPTICNDSEPTSSGQYRRLM